MDLIHIRRPAGAVPRPAAPLLLAALAACGGGSAAAPPSGPDGGSTETAQPTAPWTWAELLQLEPDRVRLMPLGDSITLGAGSVGGYRLPLFLQLQLDGVPRLEFVGSQTSNWPAGVPLTRHEGRGGWTLADLLAFPGDDTFGPSSIETLLDAGRPSLVLLHAGTNDAFEYATWQDSSARLEELLDRIEQWDPTCTVLLAQLIPTGDAAVNLCIDWYNREVARIAFERAQAGVPLQLVDMQAACPEFASGDGSDVHPDLFCYLSMAAAWRDAMEGMGQPVPAPPTSAPVVPAQGATASSFEGGYLPDLAASGVGLDLDLHRAELDVPLGWRSEPVLQTPATDGGGVVAATPPTLTIRLDGAYHVTELEVWNGRVFEPSDGPPAATESVRRIAVETSTDGVLWTPRESLELSRPPVRAQAPPERLTVDWSDARFVRLAMVETHDPVAEPAGLLRRVALAEVRLRGLPQE